MSEPTINARTVPSPSPGRGGTLASPGLTVMTGATGFLGSHLLARLLHGPDDIVALVRDDSVQTWNRLDAALKATGHPLPCDYHSRLHLEQITLSEPGLAIAPARYRELADRMHTLWHCAGMIDLVGDREQLHQTNVLGTRSVLALAGAARRRPRVIHVSTAFVAGARLSGVMYEDELDDRHGFLTSYEWSKYHTERAVHEWAAKHGHPVLILRPSVLLTDRVLTGGVPRHPHAVVGARLRALGRRGPTVLGCPAPVTEPVVVRLPGHPDSVNNIVQVEYAAEAMIRLASRPPERLVDTVHVTHPDETPWQTIADATQQFVPWLQVRLEPSHTTLSPVETVFAEQGYAGADRYFILRRSYDRSRLRAALDGALPEPAPITPAYLGATFGAHALTASSV
ncbi:NAD-dependent epimerase/dehydratase family protein [Streptomyces sp. NRRL B-1677]|uniref:SDR family oxidoreductase n=1 Tax=Streptomyces sp. NRRL B-1677 TaxID=2682966 RepID=UPI001892A728|nr:SDR family oxidoreductase [Streptomyces sp. NRRL B-1677]MBF6047978.1 NAD-dependent epimerase/dehydratase family protein [Streptomyces sp. NRRL B-1677]